jgi:hypothetical protein
VRAAIIKVSKPDAVLDEVVADAGVESAALSLLDALAEIPDPRSPRGVRLGVLAVLLVSACAVLDGARSSVVIAEYAHDAGRIVLDLLGIGAVRLRSLAARRVHRRVQDGLLKEHAVEVPAGRPAGRATDLCEPVPLGPGPILAACLAGHRARPARTGAEALAPRCS